KKQLEQECTFVGIWFHTRRLQPLYHGLCPLGRDLIESLIWPESLRHVTHGDEAVRLQAASFTIDLALRWTPVEVGNTLVDELLQIVSRHFPEREQAQNDIRGCREIFCLHR